MASPPKRVNAGEREITTYAVPNANDRDVERAQQNRINQKLADQIAELEENGTSGGGSDGGSSGGGSTPGALLKINNLSDLTNPGAAQINLGSTLLGRAFFNLASSAALTFVRVNADDSITLRSATDFKTDLGATTVGNAFFTVADPGAIRFPKVNADNTVTLLSNSDFRDALGAPGNTTEVVFNDGGVLGADSDFTYNKTTNVLSAVGGLRSANFIPSGIGANGAFQVTDGGDGLGIVYDLTGTPTDGFSLNTTTGVATFAVTPLVGVNTIWHAGNDGAGSGLDADLLDAQSGAYYLARGNHTGTQAQSTVTDLETDLAARQLDIQWKDEGVNKGSSGGITTVDFVGAGVSASDSGSTLTVTIAGGSGSPGGADTQIQYNDGGSFNGSSGMTFDESNGNVSFAGVADGTQASVTAGVSTATSLRQFRIRAAAGQTRRYAWQTGTTNRWTLDADNTAEGGSDAGSDLVLSRFSDAAAQNTVLTVTRATGRATWTPQVIQNQGTSFPGSPTTGDRYFRTDLGLECYYDGTRWLTLQQSEFTLARGDLQITADTQIGFFALDSTYDIYVERYITMMRVTGTLSGTAYWTLGLFKREADNGVAATSLATAHTLQSTTAGRYTRQETTINAVVDTGTYTNLAIFADEVTTPGALVDASVTVYYRRVVT